MVIQNMNPWAKISRILQDPIIGYTHSGNSKLICWCIKAKELRIKRVFKILTVHGCKVKVNVIGGRVFCLKTCDISAELCKFSFVIRRIITVGALALKKEMISFAHPNVNRHI